MAEQLRMPWDGGDSGRAGSRRTAHPAGGTSGLGHDDDGRRRRPRHRATGPVRGEPDVALPRSRRADWRIDQQTRLVGLRGIARARAALAASDPEHGEGQVDAA
jgi:hypothetical protein